MNSKEQKELITTINGLVAKSNGWEGLDSFFKSEERLQPILKEIKQEMAANGNFGAVPTYIRTIEKLLERIEELEEDLKEYEGTIEVEIKKNWVELRKTEPDPYANIHWVALKEQAEAPLDLTSWNAKCSGCKFFNPEKEYCEVKRITTQPHTWACLEWVPNV